VGAVTVLTTEQVLSAGDEATEYVVATPSATNETLIAPVPAFATVGVAKAEVGVTEADAAEIVETVPLRLGVTVKV
jgi:uncharacterized protein YpmB